MLLIERFVAAMEAKDHNALHDIFASGSKIVDYCPKSAGQLTFHVYGRSAVDMFYHNKFTFGGLGISQPIILDDHRASFYTSYKGFNVYGVASIVKYSEDGKIKEMVIQPGG